MTWPGSARLLLSWSPFPEVDRAYGPCMRSKNLRRHSNPLNQMPVFLIRKKASPPRRQNQARKRRGERFATGHTMAVVTSMRKRILSTNLNSWRVHREWTLKYSFCSGEVKYGLFILYWPYSQYQIGKGGRLSNSWVDGCRCSAWLLLRFCPFPMGIVCSHPIPISNCANTYAPTISSLPSYIGNGIASYFRQTGDVHLVIGSNKHWCQPLDGCSPFAEKN